MDAGRPVSPRPKVLTITCPFPLDATNRTTSDPNAGRDRRHLASPRSEIPRFDLRWSEGPEKVIGTSISAPQPGVLELRGKPCLAHHF